MCGIAGRVNHRTGAPVVSATLTKMCDLIRHRGPDGAGVWTDGAVGFGHRRLAVIDLSEAAAQPMQSADGGLTITYNGEIYNFETVRRELESRGCTFRTRSDTEVILEAYRVFGVECLSRLDGMFAFAIWDHAARRLFAARDRAGKKPFYYREDRDGFAFASEPKAFLAEETFRPSADPTALFHYLSFQYVPTPDSAFVGLKRLPAAHYLTVEDGTVTVAPYWTLRFTPKIRVSDAEAEQGVLERLQQATASRLIGDVPVGAFLSGGVDSSLVVALMSRAGGRVKTFSIGFDDAGYNELPYARRVATQFETDHHELVVRPDAVAMLPRLVWHYNEPFADSSAIPTLYLSEMTRRHVTVALNGDAGDENFAGYDRYGASLLADRVDYVPARWRRSLARLAERLPHGATRSGRSRALRFLRAAADSRPRRYARWMFHFDGEQKGDLCHPDFLDRVAPGDSPSRVESLFSSLETQGHLDTLLQVDMRSYLPDDLLVKVDIATMAFGLEGRSPFLDHHLMEYVASLPEHFKRRGHEGKFLLRRLARRLLPSEIIDRPKMGFGVPLDRWFRRELRDMAHDVLLGSRLRGRGYFRMDVVERLLSEHERGTRNWHYQIWNLLIFELWHQMFIDARPTGLPNGVG